MKHLSEKQQRLLSAYYDRELGRLATFYVEKILLKTTLAKEFLTELSGFSTKLSVGYVLPQSENKWNALNYRIAQVEKDTIFHDAHDNSEALSRDPRNLSFWGKHPLVATLATASTAFCLGLIFQLGYANYSEVNPLIGGQKEIATTSTSPLGSKGLGNVDSPVVPITVASNSSPRRAVELDWVKSDGRIRMIPARKGSSNIIWVRAPRSTYLATLQQNK